MHIRMIRTAAIALLAIGLTIPALACDWRVIDGDSIRDCDGTEIRLAGIDAPELRQTCQDGGGLYPCGLNAKAALKELTAQGITCKPDGLGRYGRIIATCFTSKGLDINSEMVLRGHALAYRKYSTAYVNHEDQAREDRIGLWRGKFVEPWRWRKGER